MIRNHVVVLKDYPMRRVAASVLLLVLLMVTVAVSAQDAEQAPDQLLPEPVALEFYNRAREAINGEDYERAVLDLSTFILLNPTDGRAYYLRAASYATLGHADIAIDDLDHAVKFTDSLPDLQSASYSLRATLYAESGRNQEALDDLGEAVALTPNIELYQNRALLYLEELDYAAAVSDLDEAVNLGADHPAIFFYRATAQTALDHDVEAAADYYQWITGIQQQVTEEDEIGAGDSVTLDMEPSLVYSIPFDAERGQVINVVAANLSGDADPLVVLIGPDGEPLAGNDGTRSGDTSAVISDFVAPERGSYSLLVTHSIEGYSGTVVVLLEMDAN
jgi:tetratricopeptide (TPR) repeat protein